MGANLALTNVCLNAGGRCILDIPNLEVHQGEVIAVIGPNGAGKSSLLKVLSQLVTPSSGNVFYKGSACTSNVSHLIARREMATVFQDSLLLTGTVEFNVSAGLVLRGESRQKIAIKAQLWMERLGIKHLAKQHTRGLSGGEAQRVSLARAFAVEPQVLFLDEPFNSLDAPTRVLLMDELEQIIHNTGVTAVFVSHDPQGIPAYANRLLVLEKGRIVDDDTMDQIMKKSSSIFLKAFFRNVPNGVTHRFMELNKLA